MFSRTLELVGSVKSLAQGVIKMLTLHGKNMTFFNELLLLSCQNILTLTIFEGESKSPLPSRDDVEVIDKHGVVNDYDIDKVVDDD